LRGHFDNWPVLPGVVQLGLIAVREARIAWPDLAALRRVRRLKLKRPIAPEQWVVLDLERRADGRVDFTLSHEGEPCSSGSMMFGSPSVLERDGASNAS
jgi:3-hydroxymyristoyl/3-hydroxydecanoyl-(acyl carrier protein) dehydratase